MANKRKDDKQEGTYFRSDRIVRENDRFFFITREGAMEGPYLSEREVQKHLEDYIKLMKNRSLEGTEKFTLMPMEPSTPD